MFFSNLLCICTGALKITKCKLYIKFLNYYGFVTIFINNGIFTLFCEFGYFPIFRHSWVRRDHGSNSAEIIKLTNGGKYPVFNKNSLRHLFWIIKIVLNYLPFVAARRRIRAFCRFNRLYRCHFVTFASSTPDKGFIPIRIIISFIVITLLQIKVFFELF